MSYKCPKCKKMFLEGGINKYGNQYYHCNYCNKDFYVIQSKLYEIDYDD